MSNAFAGQGSKLKRGDGGGTEAFTAISEITNIQRTGSKADQVDVTNMDSTGAYREYIPTLLDAGEVSFTGNYIPGDATQAQLQTDFDNRRLGNWQITLPNSLGHWAFAAFVTGFDFDLSHDKQSTITCKLKVTGKPLFTAGS